MNTSKAKIRELAIQSADSIIQMHKGKNYFPNIPSVFNQAMNVFCGLQEWTEEQIIYANRCIADRIQDVGFD